MSLKKNMYITTKMFFNVHLLLFLSCIILFNLVIRLQQELVVSVNCSLLSCYAFYEIESIDYLSGVDKAIASIKNGKLKSRVTRNFVLFFFNILFLLIFFLFNFKSESIFLGIISYCVCLSLWYFLEFIFRNPVVVFSFSILYVFVWMIYYKRFSIIYLNPFYYVQSHYGGVEMAGAGALSIAILIISIFLHKNRYLQNFTI